MSLFTTLRQYVRETLYPASKTENRDVADSHDGAYAPVILSRGLAERTQELLRSFNNGDRGSEGIVYWAGVSSGRGGAVTTLIVPDAEADYGRVQTTPLENASVIRWLDEHGLVLLGQAHSHPPGAGNRHSLGDDEMTFSPFEGQISVVVSDHARADHEFLDTWGAHRFIRGDFRYVPPDEWEDHLQIVPDSYDRRSEPTSRGGSVR